jgi:hypothetical protein
VALFLIYGQVEDAMFVGLGFMIFLIPIQGFVFGTLFKYQKIFVKLTDKRVGIMNEVLSGIRIVKYYVWESAFASLVAKMRTKEIVVLTKLAYVVAVGFSLVLLSAPIIQPVLIFTYFVEGEGRSLDAATAFTTIALFNLLRFPFAFLPMGLVQYLNCKVASARLTRFLTRKTITEYVGQTTTTSTTSTAAAASKAKKNRGMGGRGGGSNSYPKSVPIKSLPSKNLWPSEAETIVRQDSDVMLCMREATLGWGTSEPLQDPFANKKKKERQEEEQGQERCRGGEEGAGTVAAVQGSSSSSWSSSGSFGPNQHRRSQGKAGGGRGAGWQWEELAACGFDGGNAASGRQRGAARWET